MDCGSKMRELRESTGMNRKEFCQFFGIPYRTVTDWESDNRHAPEYVLRLLEYYDMRTFVRRMKNMNNSNMIMYTTEDGLTKIEVTFDEDTVWLSLEQMAELFQRDKSTISRHIKNIFADGELNRNSVVANFATTAADGKTY